MKRMLMVLLSVLVLAASPALAKDVKIGFVDLQRALNQSKAGLSAKEKMGEKVKSYEADVQKRQEELRKLREELEKQAMMLTEDARARKEREYQQKLRDFQRLTKDIQEELQQQDADFTRGILDELVRIIGEYGEKEGYDMILEQTESSLLFASARVDLTEAIIKMYDARFNAKK